MFWRQILLISADSSWKPDYCLQWRHDTRHNDIQHNDTQAYFVTLSINNTQHNNNLPLCWVWHFIHFYTAYHYAECLYAESHYAESHYAESHYAECHYAESRYAECRGAVCNPIKLFFRHWRCSKKARVFDTGKFFQTSLLFASKARSQPKILTERCSILVGSGLAIKDYTSL